MSGYIYAQITQSCAQTFGTEAVGAPLYGVTRLLTTNCTQRLLSHSNININGCWTIKVLDERVFNRE